MLLNEISFWRQRKRCYFTTAFQFRHVCYNVLSVLKKLSKSVIDRYEKGLPLPHVQFLIKWKKEKVADISPESYPRVNIVGAKPDHDHFIIPPVPAAIGEGSIVLAIV